MEPTARIPAASKQEAMDWSLVLVSQGIESKIDTASENQEWWLEVSLHEWDRAIETLRKYRRENKRWLWRRQVTSKGLLFDWAALSWVVLITVFYWAASQLPAIMKAGSMDTAAASGGQWWRLCTAVWLHADIAHLASNAAVGIVLLGLALGLYGTGTGMLAAYLAGIGGNFIAWAVATTSHRSLGASGLVMGCIGLMAAHTLLIRGPNRLKLFITSFVAALMLFVLLGLSPGTDIVAHAGGAASGFVIGALLALARVRPESAKLNMFCGLLFFLLTIVPWILALYVNPA